VCYATTLPTATSYSAGDKWIGMGHWQNDTDGNNKVLMENPIPVPQCPIQIQDRVTWDWTQASVVRNSRSFIKLHNTLPPDTCFILCTEDGATGLP
jgi:hypothetical protein